jgi:hypothetical protein
MSNQIGDVVIEAFCPRCGQKLKFKMVSELTWAYDEPRLPSVTATFAFEVARNEDGSHTLHGGECGRGWLLR